MAYIQSGGPGMMINKTKFYLVSIFDFFPKNDGMSPI